MKHRASTQLTAVAVMLGALAAAPRSALACGGFFCSQQQPVNQAAERIIFADNGDGTITAVIQILYQGPSANFSWVLPVTSVIEPGQLALGSDLAFARLQSATNPQYNLTTRLEGECESFGFGGSAGGGGGAGFPAPPEACAATPQLPGCDVSVEGSGVIGAFDYTVLSVAADAADPAASAREWLTTNGYDVTAQGAALLAPYLADGMHLLALRLTKGADAGSIRPIQITYPASAPMIPIKLTAVAANQDMGVMTWAIGSARAVPFNYNALELNEARINWFNASSNYNQVVIEAANAAGGQGFVTEFAGPGSDLADVVWSADSEREWQSVEGATYSSFASLFDALSARYQSYSGFWDAVRGHVTLPEGVSLDDFKLCPTCYGEELQFSPAELVAAVDAEVIEPMRSTQRLLDRGPYVTRFYSTLSADEMTVDPVFVFNPDLPPVSNFHAATRVIECSPGVSQSAAPWRIELPQGDIVRGSSGNVVQWPDALAQQPANLRILALAPTGQGQVVADNHADIQAQLASYNASFEGPTPGSAAGGDAGPGGSGGPVTAAPHSSGCDCGLARPSRSPSLPGFALAGLLAAAALRRRKA